MNERLEHFVSEMREFDSLSETDPSLPFPRLEASLYDDCDSFLPLEPNVIGDAPWTDLEVELEPPLISLSFVALSSSSTPMDTIVSDLTLLASLLPLAQCTGLEMGEKTKGDIRDIKDFSPERLKQLCLAEPCLEEAPFVELYGHIVMGSATSSIGLIDSIRIDLLT